MNNTAIIGDPSEFAIQYTFEQEEHATELAMYVHGKNILAFNRGGREWTTRWNLDEIALWLRNFIDHMQDDPYPVEVEGTFAAHKDISARAFETDDEEAFDAYYDLLDDWNLRHRWHSASAGAILADVYFQAVGENVEISWNNEDVMEDVRFQYPTGGARIEKHQFYRVVDAFLKEYAAHWPDE